MANIKDNVQDIYEDLRAADFKISKQIVAFQSSELLVDDITKRFAVIDNSVTHIFNYIDLLSFEYYEYCEPVTNDNANPICEYIKVRLLLNNLNKPQIEIACLPVACVTSSNIYQDAKQVSTEITATLNYILNYNNQQSNNNVNQTEQKLSSEQTQGNTNEEFSKNTPKQQSTSMPPANDKNKSNKGVLTFIIIVLVCVAIIAVVFTSNSSDSDTTNETNEVTENTNEETENTEKTNDVTDEDLKEFDKKSWEQFVYIFKAHTDFVYNISLYTDGNVPTSDFYNYCKEMKSYFENVVSSLDYGVTDDEKAYLDTFKAIVSADGQAAENLINYIDLGKEEDLSKAQENVKRADDTLLNIANIRADLLEKAGYTNEEIDEIIYNIRADLTGTSN